MPSWILNIYNKDGSTLLGSGNSDLSYNVTDTGIIDTVDGSYINVSFSNSNVIGYASTPNAIIPEYHIGSTFGLMVVGIVNLYEVEGDKYSITTSKSNITINCKDKTMEKDLQISFNGAGTNSNITINVLTYQVAVTTGNVGVHYSVDGGNEFLPIEAEGTISLENVSTIIFKYVGYSGGGAPGIGSYCRVGTEERGKNIINAGDSEYHETIITPMIKPNDGDIIYVEMEYS